MKHFRIKEFVNDDGITCFCMQMRIFFILWDTICFTFDDLGRADDYKLCASWTNPARMYFTSLDKIKQHFQDAVWARAFIIATERRIERLKKANKPKIHWWP